MNGRNDEETNGQVERQTDERMDIIIETDWGKRMSEWTKRHTDWIRTDERTEGLTDRRTDEQTDRLDTDGQSNWHKDGKNAMTDGRTD